MYKLLIFLLLLSETLTAQNINIKVVGMENWRASLFSLELEKSNFIESIISNGKGQFKIPENELHTGFYRLAFNNRVWLNFVYDGKEIEIETIKDSLVERLKVIKSDVNKTYYKYLNLSSAYKMWEKKLQEAGTKYPNNDKYLKHIKKEFTNIYDEYWTYVNNFSQTKNNSFISRYISSASEPQIKSGLDTDAKIKYLKEHFWDNVDFSDTGLLYSDLFTNKTKEFLSYFSNPHLSKDSFEKEYQSAVEIILNKAKINEFIYQQMIEYLIKGFKKLGFEKVIDYIVDNFIITDDLCLDSPTEDFIQIRINQSKTFKKNVKVPNIKLPDFTGKTIELYNTSAEKVLILFYSSQCPHCQKLLPQIFKIYSNETLGKFKVYAVSLDTDFTLWQNFVNNNKYNWINVSDMKGWESIVSYNYYVYATPTMFLVDRNFEIIDRPKNLEDLKTDLLKY